MRKRIKGSVESLPRSAYIFLKSALRLCCVMLFISLLLFASCENTIQDYEKFKLAVLFLENPAGVLMFGLLGTALLIDRS